MTLIFLAGRSLMQRITSRCVSLWWLWWLFMMIMMILSLCFCVFLCFVLSYNLSLCLSLLFLMILSLIIVFDDIIFDNCFSWYYLCVLCFLCYHITSCCVSLCCLWWYYLWVFLLVLWYHDINNDFMVMKMVTLHPQSSIRVSLMLRDFSGCAINQSINQRINRCQKGYLEVSP